MPKHDVTITPYRKHYRIVCSAGDLDRTTDYAAIAREIAYGHISNVYKKNNDDRTKKSLDLRE